MNKHKLSEILKKNFSNNFSFKAVFELDNEALKESKVLILNNDKHKIELINGKYHPKKIMMN